MTRLAAGDVRLASLDVPPGAAGTVVVADVFRAFTTAAVALAGGAARIVIVGGLDEALALRADGTARFAMGERGGLRPEGFDFGNSPVELAGHDFAGATLVQTTSNGTRGLLQAGQAARIFAGAFVTAAATARAILADPVLPVTIVAMGNKGVRADEDEIYALYLRALLTGRVPERQAARRLVATGADLSDTRKLSDADVAASLEIDRYGFAVRVHRDAGRLSAAAEPSPPRKSGAQPGSAV